MDRKSVHFRVDVVHGLAPEVVEVLLAGLGLNESQRAMVAARAKGMFEAAARERQRKGGEQKLPANLPEAGEARAKAAALANVSPRSVESACVVLKSGDEKLVAVDGDATRDLRELEGILRAAGKSDEDVASALLEAGEIDAGRLHGAVASMAIKKARAAEVVDSVKLVWWLVQNAETFELGAVANWAEVDAQCERLRTGAPKKRRAKRGEEAKPPESPVCPGESQRRTSSATTPTLPANDLVALAPLEEFRKSHANGPSKLSGFRSKLGLGAPNGVVLAVAATTHQKRPREDGDEDNSPGASHD